MIAVACTAIIATTAGPVMASSSADKLNGQLDTALVKTEQQPTSANPEVSLPNDSKAQGSLEGPHGEITITLPSTGKPLSSTNDRTIFRGANSQSSLTLESTDESLRSLIAIDNAFAPERWSFTIGGDVTKLALLPDGGVIALDSAGGVVAGAPAPWAVDAKGKAIPTHYEIKGTTLTQVVKHRPTLKTLRTPTAYPVVADPSFDMNIEAALQRCAIHAGGTLGATIIADIKAGKKIDLQSLVQPALNSCIKGMTTGTMLANADFSGVISTLLNAIKTGNFDLGSIDVGALIAGLIGGSNDGTTGVGNTGTSGLDLSAITDLLGGSTGSLDLIKILGSIDLSDLTGPDGNVDIAKVAKQLLPVVIELLPLLLKMI